MKMLSVIPVLFIGLKNQRLQCSFIYLSFYRLTLRNVPYTTDFTDVYKFICRFLLSWQVSVLCSDIQPITLLLWHFNQLLCSCYTDVPLILGKLQL